jgi:hypothetical protein
MLLQQEDCRNFKDAEEAESEAGEKDRVEKGQIADARKVACDGELGVPLEENFHAWPISAKNYRVKASGYESYWPVPTVEQCMVSNDVRDVCAE